MGCVIKYKGQSIPEGQFLQYLNKQIAINNLFETNGDFASKIYEALGFNNDNIELKPYATDVWGKVPQQRGDNTFVSKEQYSIKLGEDKGIDIRLTIYFDDINKTAFVSNIENFENDRIHPLKKGLGLKGFLKANQLIINRGYTPIVDNLVSGYGYDMLSKLEKNGYLTKVLDKKAVDSQYDNIKYEKAPFIFTNKIYEYGLTPEQKQQAISKFQEYVNTTGKQDIQGFKDFVSKKINNNKADESINERLMRYEESIKIPNNVKSKVLEKIEKETEKVKEKLLSLGLKQDNNKFELITNSYATFKMKLKELENVNAIISTNKTSDFYQIIARLKNTDSTMELKKQGELPFTPIEVKQVIQEQQFLNDVADNVFEGLSEEEKQILKKKIENGDYDLNCRI